MKILFLTTAHNSLSQRLLIELTERGHEVAVTLASSDEAMLKGAAENEPELIIAPMLKAAIPKVITDQHLCLIVHPGIKGDRGPSSLDWAIKNGERVWGATVLEASDEWDAGPIWATREFKMPTPAVSKSQLYRQEVTEAAVAAVLEAVEKFRATGFTPEVLDYTRPDVRGTWRSPMRQADRAIDWSQDSTEAIVTKINAADSAPGVLDRSFGAEFYLYDAHVEDRLKGAPGAFLAQRNGAICVGTKDGAVWITHMKLKDRVDRNEAGCGVPDPGPGCVNCALDICPAAQIKLPATMALGRRAANAPKAPLPIDAAPDYRTFQEIRYVEDGSVGRLHFEFSNGAMSTRQCFRLRDAFLYARSRPTKIIELVGGADFFSNGIHLNVIEASDDPALESWRNIIAIDDVVLEILNTMSHLVVAGFCGNAGAGGAILPLAADYVYAREGVVFNPHYKGMGGLYGSEYLTYLLPRRVGAERALELTECLKPMGTRDAKRIGFIDDAFGASVAEFQKRLAERSAALATRQDFWLMLRDKHERRLADERVKPLAAYRAEELAQMRENFWGPDPAYHAARRRFVYKGEPRRIAVKPLQSAVSPSPGLFGELRRRVRAFAGRGAL
ncbi:hydrogenase maturation protein [Methylocystis bryophila]|uniref:Hydrogenase maturation protein n=1 Tax=Methylocystis bryophila TaxID=655015 RepID=A0A1W6MQL8_9HYPH|nr:hydrogenase maturation protein [Methylocystis bryophila]ARN79865.1 hydrogenase maturation protein [Methylocystis bryophila]BDV39755.1 formyl transferase [Methylocystis bryophila]